MRRGALVLAAAAAAVGSLATAAVAGNSPKHAYTAQGQALAKAIVLKASDLPAGLVATPEGSSSSNGPTCSYYNPNQSDLTEVGRADAPQFAGKSGLPQFHNYAAVFASADQGRTAYGRVAKPELAKCLAELLAKGAPKGVVFKTLGTKTSHVAGAGDQNVVVEVDMSLEQGKQHVPFYVVVGAVNKGAVDSALMSVSLGAPYAGFPQLLQKVASRMP